MRIVLDRDKCASMGMCEAEAPELFELQGGGELAVLDETPDEDRRAEAESACEACPTLALSIVED